jgi:hypothetical protein
MRQGRQPLRFSSEKLVSAVLDEIAESGFRRLHTACAARLPGAAALMWIARWAF